MKKQLILFRSFFVISAVTLGGGLAMIPVIQKAFTEKNKWLTDEDMTRFIMSIQQAARLILRAGELANGGEIFILKRCFP